jgi:hypothetical protein
MNPFLDKTYAQQDLTIFCVNADCLLNKIAEFDVVWMDSIGSIAMMPFSH